MDEQYTPIDIVLDSNDRNGGSKDYPQFVLGPPIEDVVGATVFYANVPFTYDVVDHYNRVNSIRMFGGVLQNYDLSVGTYNSATILTELKQKLVDSSFSNASTFNFFIQNDSNKLIIYNTLSLPGSGPDTAAFEWHTTNSRSSAEILGFEPGKVYNSQRAVLKDNADNAIGNVQYIESPFSVNLSGSGQMYLHCPQLQGYLKGAVRAGPNMSDIVAFWPVNANYLSYIIYQNSIPAVVPFTQTTISSLDFYLSIGSKSLYADVDGVPRKFISLKGQTFQIGIRFYKKNGEFITAYIDGSGNKSQRVSSKRTGRNY